MASYIPMLAEEGLASIRGIKQAKKYLSPDIVKGLKGNYLKAFGTYAGIAVLVSWLTALGVKIAKDGVKGMFKQPAGQDKTAMQQI